MPMSARAQEIYLWPYFARIPLEALTPEQKVELFRIVTGADYKDMVEFGAYSFYRLGIAPRRHLAFLRLRRLANPPRLAAWRTTARNCAKVEVRLAAKKRGGKTHVIGRDAVVAGAGRRDRRRRSAAEFVAANRRRHRRRLAQPSRHPVSGSDAVRGRSDAVRGAFRRAAATQPAGGSPQRECDNQASRDHDAGLEYPRKRQAHRLAARWRDAFPFRLLLSREAGQGHVPLRHRDSVARRRHAVPQHVQGLRDAAGRRSRRGSKAARRVNAYHYEFADARR